MGIETDKLQQLAGVGLADRILMDASAGTGLLRVEQLAQFLTEPGTPVETYYRQLSNNTVLDNWYLADPINQLAQKEYAANRYGIDRWWCDGTVTINDGYITTTGAFYQSIPKEEAKQFLGKQLTLSALYSDGTFETGTCRFPNAFPEETTSLSASANLGIALLGSGAVQIFRLKNAKKVVAVKTEPGNRQTLAHKEGSLWVLNDTPPNKALVLLKCQRYFYVINGSGNSVGGFGLGLARAGLAIIMVPVQSNFRAYPALSTQGEFALLNAKTYTDPIAVEAIKVERNTKDCGLFLRVEASGLVPGDLYYLISNKDASARIILDANL